MPNCPYFTLPGCSNCHCGTIEIVSDGITTTAHEYNDTETLGINIPNSLGYEYWENHKYLSDKDSYDNHNIDHPQRLLAVDLHSSNFWQKYSQFKRETNLKYNDLLGSYNLVSCSEDYRKSNSPVYKKILDDGTEAYFYKHRLGIRWQVTANTCIYIMVFKRKY